MMAHQDYAGKLEFLVLDGACHSTSACNTHLVGAPSGSLVQAAASDKRLRCVFVAVCFVYTCRRLIDLSNNRSLE